MIRIEIHEITYLHFSSRFLFTFRPTLSFPMTKPSHTLFLLFSPSQSTLYRPQLTYIYIYIYIHTPTKYPIANSLSIAISSPFSINQCLGFGFSRTALFVSSRTPGSTPLTEAVKVPTLVANYLSTLRLTKWSLLTRFSSVNYRLWDGKSTTIIPTFFNSTNDPPFIWSRFRKISTSSNPCTCTISSSRTVTCSKSGMCSSNLQSFIIFFSSFLCAIRVKNKINW